MKYYKSMETKKIVNEKFIKGIDFVYGVGTLETMISDGLLKEIDPPTVEECIIHGSGSLAVQRYMELHPDASWEESSHAIDSIKAICKEEKERKR